VFKHPVDAVQKLAHHRYGRDDRPLPTRYQLLVEGTNVSVIAHGHQCRHVERPADPSVAHFRYAFALLDGGPRDVPLRVKARVGDPLSDRHVFWQEGEFTEQEDAALLGDAWRGYEPAVGAVQVVALAKDLQGLPDEFVDATRQVAQVDLDIIGDDRGGHPAGLMRVEPVLLAGPFDSKSLNATRDGSEFARGLFRRLPRFKRHPLNIVAEYVRAEYVRVECIGLRAAQGGFAEVFDGSRVGHHDFGAVGLEERQRDVQSVATAGFYAGPDASSTDPVDEVSVPGGCVWKAATARAVLPPGARVEMVFADINADEAIGRLLHLPVPGRIMRSSKRPGFPSLALGLYCDDAG